MQYTVHIHQVYVNLKSCSKGRRVEMKCFHDYSNIYMYKTCATNVPEHASCLICFYFNCLIICKLKMLVTFTVIIFIYLFYLNAIVFTHTCTVLLFIYTCNHTFCVILVNLTNGHCRS